MKNETRPYAWSVFFNVPEMRVTVEIEDTRCIDEPMQNSNKFTFMRLMVQAFPSCFLVNSHQQEELTFFKIVRQVPKVTVLASANIVSSHVLFKVTREDAGSMLLNGHIALTGNEDAVPANLCSDYCMCAPPALQILLSVSTLRQLRLM